MKMDKLRVLFLSALFTLFCSQSIIAEPESKAASLCSSTFDSDCLKEGDAHYEAGRYSQALSLYNELCNKDNAEACHNKGWVNEKGLVETASGEEAIASYRKGCQLNYRKSCHNLAVAYEFWPTVDEPVEKVAELYSKGCDLGYANSCFNLAINYAEGDGVEQNFDEYLRLNERACVLKEARGCEVLGDHYDDTAQMKLSLKFHLMGCELGEAYNCQQAAWKYGYDLGEERDYGLYHKYNVTACDMGNRAACHNAGRMLIGYSEIEAPSFASDKKKGLEYLMQACHELEFAVACADAGDAYEKGDGTKVDLKLSRDLQKRGCDDLEEPSSYACYSLAYIYYYGNDSFKRDKKKSRRYFKKACDLGDEEACDYV